MKTFKTLFLIHFQLLIFFYLTMIPIFSSSNEIAKLKTIIFLCWKTNDRDSVRVCGRNQQIG